MDTGHWKLDTSKSINWNIKFSGDQCPNVYIQRNKSWNNAPVGSSRTSIESVPQFDCFESSLFERCIVVLTVFIGQHSCWMEMNFNKQSILIRCCAQNDSKVIRCENETNDAIQFDSKLNHIFHGLWTPIWTIELQ